MTLVSRFAPSPTGALHLGHAYSAIFAHDYARAHDGEFVLRIEDIDGPRCRPEYEQAILRDLRWLGLTWREPVRRQSQHMADYQRALDRLRSEGLLYPCFCTRKEIAAEIAQSPRAPHGPEGALYPGTCRLLAVHERAQREAAEPFALRLDVKSALRRVGQPLFFEELGGGPGGETGQVRAEPATLGDVVLARKEVRTSYHLAVTVDDAIEGVTHVTRGNDLFFATHMHRLLQALLELPVPRYVHHSLVSDDSGRRLAKRHDALSLATLRESGVSADEVRRRLGFEGSVV